MRSALAIDLDGTLLATNTFRDYLAFCGRQSLLHFRPDIALAILWWVMLRKVRLVSHSTMKCHLLNRTASFMQCGSFLDEFVEHELTCVNTRVQQFIEPYRNRGCLLILCTAAPALYAHPLAENLYLHLCCATPLPSEVVIGAWHENVGQQKLENLRRLLQVHKAELVAVVTDHHDDLPLLNYNEGDNFLVAPSSETLQQLRQHCQRPFSQL